jgi:putative copper export protein
VIVIEALKTVSSQFAAARAVHMTSCAALASVFVFERLITRRCGAVPKRGFVILMSLVMFLVSGIGWLAAATIDMTGLPASEALSRENLHLVLSTTDFGHLWIFRFAVFGAAIVAWIVLRMIRKQRQPTAWLVVSIILLGSLAWAGHGRFGTNPTTHLVADVMHLLIIAIWPAGLLPLWLMLSKNINVDLLVAIVNRFSKLALISVAILIGSGWVNSWMLIAEWHALFDTAYGQVLLIKLGLLLTTVLLGAANLLYVRPRIAQTENAIRVLRWNVAIETAAAAGIMLAVGYLGLLPPPADPSTIPCCPVVAAWPAACAPGNPLCGFPGIGGA